MLGVFVFAAQQPERSFGSRTGHDTGAVHGDAREHRHAVAAFGKYIRLGVHKILRTQDADILHGGYLVGIVETRVDNGNRHSLSLEAFFVQLIAIAQPYLVDSQSINAVGMHARAVYQRVALRCHERPVTSGSYPYLFRLPDKRQGGNALHQCRVVAGHRNKILPLAGNDNLHALPANLIHILTAYRKVCRVYRKVLLQATLNRLFREERFRMFQRIRGGSLVLQADAILQSVLPGRCTTYSSQDEK